MPTEIRPELSKKNKYWIPKHRYYELKHFVMQYNEWREKLEEIDSFVRATQNGGVQIWDMPDPVSKAAELRDRYNKNIEICNKAMMDTYPEDFFIGNCILIAVINNNSYEQIRAKYPIPCGKDMYYELYHKFFYLLDAARK